MKRICCSVSHVQLFTAPWTAACQASLSFIIPWSLLKLISIESAIASNPLILCRPLLLLPSIFPASRSFPVSWLFTSSGWGIGDWASASVLPMNIQDWISLGLTGLIFLQCKGLSRVFSNTTAQKPQFFGVQPSLCPTHMATVKAISSVQFSRSVMSDSSKSHESQHTRPPCPSPTPGVHPTPCPLSWWCHPTISSSVVPYSSCTQSFPASGSFQMNQFFASGGQSFGVSATTSVLPMNTQDWSPLGWTGWIFLQSKGLSRVFSNTTVQKHQFFTTQLSL